MEATTVTTRKRVREQIDAREILSNRHLVVDLVVLYVFWSLFGVLLEGSYTLVSTGRWETHVVSMTLPLCVIYGFGSVFYYLVSAKVYNKHWAVRLAVFALTGTILELLCGVLLLHGLHMRAWDYTDSFMNYKGLICLPMFLVWGLFGMVFCHFMPQISGLLRKLHKKAPLVISWVLAVLLTVDLVFALMCVVRWKNRRDAVPPANTLEQTMDRRYPNEYMQTRFVEWRFLDEQ